MRTVMTGIVAAVLLLAAQSCTTKAPQYVDLNTNTPFHLVKHPQTGLMVDAETGKPLNIFVDTKTQDTIYGRTGEVVNGRVTKVDESFYAFAQPATEADRHLAGMPASSLDQQSEVHFSAHENAK